MSPLIEINALVAGAEGVYSSPASAEADFAYSDGDAAERYLERVLAGAGDLSSDSEELQRAIRDWPSEYHLSPKRANLLRPLPLPAGARVLELGCGCGAVTRYLGDRGFSVDAIEGSAVRARLARMRCRGLDDVTVVQANFNRLELPAAEYDVALLIGVAEYARRFSPDSGSDRDAVVDLLRRVRDALKDGGVLLVAIENRTGMKYLHGAHEDHYARRFVGIDNYPESAGIRTYTRREWRSIADDAGLPQQALLYPFPDYKLPTVYLGEDYADRDENAWCHLEGVDSVDYTFLFDPYIPETLTWQGYSAAGVLGDLANSFTLVLSRSADLDDFAAIDFVHLPDFRRKRAFCTVVSKRRDESEVRRENLGSGSSTTEPYLAGTLLSARWVRAIVTESGPNAFHACLKDYVSFIEARARDGSLPPDLLPNNIVVDLKGGWRVFDQEWSADGDVDTDYLLFRATLTFANHYRAAIRHFARRFELYDVGGFVRHCFRVVNRGNRLPEDFCAREDAFQDGIILSRGSNSRTLLSQSIVDSPVDDAVSARLSWSDGDDDNNDVVQTLAPGAEPVTLAFDLPPGATRVDAFRFSPCDHHRPHDTGFFNVEAVRVLALGETSRRVLWSLDGEDLVLSKARLSQVSVVEVGRDRVLAVAGDEPYLAFSPHAAIDRAAGQHLRVEVVVNYAPSRDYLLARQDFLVKEAAMKQQIEALESHLARVRADLSAIRASTTWRLATKLRRTFKRGR